MPVFLIWILVLTNLPQLDNRATVGPFVQSLFCVGFTVGPYVCVHTLMNALEGPRATIKTRKDWRSLVASRESKALQE